MALYGNEAIATAIKPVRVGVGDRRVTANISPLPLPPQTTRVEWPDDAPTQCGFLAASSNTLQAKVSKCSAVSV